MQTKFEFNEKINTCIIYLADDMNDSETREALDELKTNAKIKKSDKFIAVIPPKFTACEEFRIQIHRYILAMRKQKPEFKLGVVTTLLGVIGYERFAKAVLQMVEQEQIFETLDKAISWLS